ncbi:uncharacterized protein LOC113557842 [Rhopalosiphum maidis]|uniref:uncharacterized protein LOC113557842 n=1 Tax=Rhopalosiphum maidis TaxID=43146 RepID=UPI000EFEF35B|nr:uncharacterized protein LOC113557842 [Rhopalosiphum maidis]
MTNYSIIEFKLRRFIFLGEKTSIYVSPVHKEEFWKDKNRQDSKITGLKLIGDIIRKNKTTDINSIVPIISKFSLENCQKMKTDAYAMVLTICIDGLKLLMFYKFCNSAAKLLYKNGYISTKSSGFGGGTQKVLRKWYLSKEPLETIKAIMKHKTYCGINHKHVMGTTHLYSKDPSHQIYITYISFGIKRMVQTYEEKLLIKDNDSKEEKLSKTLQLYVYNYINEAHRIRDSTNSKLAKDLKWNNVGKDYEIVVSKMLKSPKVLTNFVKQLPLKTLLDNTYTFARHHLFQNETGNEGCMEFILRFNNYKAIQEAEIHPIQPYLEYLRYTRSGRT